MSNGILDFRPGSNIRLGSNARSGYNIFVVEKELNFGHLCIFFIYIYVPHTKDY